MSTERFDPSDLIGSEGDAGGTQRFDGNIISSEASLSANKNNSAGTQRIDGSVISSETTLAVTVDTSKGFLLDNKQYNVIKLIASSGEAEIFLVEEGGKQQVLKYYFSNYKPKDEVIKKLQRINRPDIIYPLAYGYHQDRFWEINEYMTGGTLNEVLPLRDTSRFKELVDRISEAIHYCHTNRIIHRDIKPVNIFFRYPDRREIVLGDFGIASPLQDGEDYRVTTVARTTTYAAPELFTNINNYTTLDNSVDYYALGISLLEAWKGEDPFRGISQFNIMRIKNEGRVQMPADINKEIEMLIKGLITTEPPKRWGYEEIRKWLRGEPVKVYYQTHEATFKPYEFDQVQGIYVKDPKELAFYIDRYPQKGKLQLYSGMISRWVESASQDLYSELYNIVEKQFPKDEEAGIAKAIYLLDKDRPFKSYDGSEWYSPADLGAHIEQHAAFYKTELSKPAAKLYLFLETKGFQDRADKYRKYYSSLPVDKAFNLVVLDLQDQVLLIEGQVFSNLNQLTSAAAGLQQRIINAIADPDSKLSAWLDSMHNHLADNLNRWRLLDDLDLVTLKYALKTGGFSVAGKEVFNEKELHQLMQELPGLFTTDADAETNRDEADYWLVNYQESSFLTVITDNRFLMSPDRTFEQFAGLYEFLLEDHDSSDPFSITASIAGDLPHLMGNDRNKLKKITEISYPSYAKYMGVYKKNKVYATESLYDIVAHIKTIYAVYPELGGEVLLSINNEMDSFVHEDFVKLQKNSTYFDMLSNHLRDFLKNSVTGISTSLPYYKHWDKEQQLIARRSALIEHELDKELDKEQGTINKKFNEYFEGQLNYLDKGKHFHMIFTRSLGWAIALIFFLIAWNSSGFSASFISPRTSFIVYGVLVLIGTRLLINYVKRRRPNAGLGMVLDPLHRFVGKTLYRPILKKIKNDPDNAIVKKTQLPRQNELLKAAEINKGKRYDKLFEERVRIILLPDADLDAELAKS